MKRTWLRCINPNVKHCKAKQRHLIISSMKYFFWYLIVKINSAKPLETLSLLYHLLMYSQFLHLNLSNFIYKTLELSM